MSDTVSSDEVIRKLQSGEWLIISREKMAEFRAKLTYPVASPIMLPDGEVVHFTHTLDPRLAFVVPPINKPWEQKTGFKINLGSGQRPFEKPWINVDSNPKWQPDIVADGSNLRGHFEDNTAEIIVVHHCVEHVGCGEATEMIRECHRVLHPGGTLLIFVPEMRELARGWLAGKITDQIYFTNVYGAFLGDESGRHRWGYTEQTMIDFLHSCCKWSDARPFNWRSIPNATIAGPDWWICGVEVTK